MREGEGALEGGEDEVAFDGLGRGEEALEGEGKGVLEGDKGALEELWVVLGLSPFQRKRVRLRLRPLLPFLGDVLLALGERGLGELLVEINVSVCSVASLFSREEAAV